MHAWQFVEIEQPMTPLGVCATGSDASTYMSPVFCSHLPSEQTLDAKNLFSQLSHSLAAEL
jgi:hypothetical protein